MIHLTSCTRIHEPGFSKSEAMELARRFKNGDWRISERFWDKQDREMWRTVNMSVQGHATIVAALRAFAE